MATSAAVRAIAEGRTELTEPETLEYLNDLTREALGMTLDEFVRRADEGTLPEHPAVPHLVLLTGARPGPC
jgi:hypothetical protein